MKLANIAPKKKQQMGTSPHPHHPTSIFFTKKFLFRATYLLLILAFLRHYVFNPSPTSPTTQQQQQQQQQVTKPPIQSKKTSTLPPNSDVAAERCDYAEGRWVRSERGPLYNGTSCGTIKEAQNCMAHGRPDTGYLHWRWQPSACPLRPFDPLAFLALIRDRHLAFVGDSLARNQLESLLCLLSSASPPDLVYKDGGDDVDSKFRRWAFRSHNATVSVFWSPFLVAGIEKSLDTGRMHNQLFLDRVDERWASELENIDAVVLSIGHWFLLPAFYNEGGRVVGCHHCPGTNHTEVGFFDVFRKAIRTALKDVAQRRRGLLKNVVVTTFSPAHFDGEWDKAGACPKKEPFGEGEKEMEYMDAEMRKIEVEEVAVVSGGGGKHVRFEALDVTKLALMRPDGHPGPYMYPNPFADGPKERVPNDCVHWCMPGPVDTWNEILLEMMRRWSWEKEKESSR